MWKKAGKQSLTELINVIFKLLSEYGTVLRIWLGPELNVFVADPDDLKTLLSNPKTNVKGPQYKYIADLLGGGILSGSGPKWRKHRKIANPNYGRRAVEGYTEIFTVETDLLLQQLPTRRFIDIYPHVVRTTSYTVCQTLMGLTREQTLNLPYLEDIIDGTHNMYETCFSRMTKWYLQIDPVFWMTSMHKRQNIFLKKIAEFSEQIINHRIEALKTLEKTKLELMNSSDDTSSNTLLSVIDRFILSQELNWEELLKETFTVFTSSQEASAKMSCFLLLMMGYHPDCQEKLYSEIKTIFGDDDRPVTEEDLKGMPYLDMAFKEVLRLFPIGPLLQRVITEDFPISSGVIPAGTSLVVPVYHLHRDTRHWKNPNLYDPERFTPENCRSRHPYSYIPFSMGHMDCLGRHFGTKLVKTVVVNVLRKYKVESLGTYNDLRLILAISVALPDGFDVKLTPRT